MIFVTVGTQLPFDRMIRTIDDWAATTGREDVFAQIGPSKYIPRKIQYADFLPADQCRSKIEQAKVIIAHAGMGSIITALELAKPIIVMPRSGDLGEHRNNHQISTAQKFAEQGSIHVAWDEKDLLKQLADIDRIQIKGTCDRRASPELLTALRDFVQWGKLPKRIVVEREPAFGDLQPATNTR
jgi:UDP-N-acetylglucosamine transferase subunit ALG13